MSLIDTINEMIRNYFFFEKQRNAARKDRKEGFMEPLHTHN